MERLKQNTKAKMKRKSIVALTLSLLCLTAMGQEARRPFHTSLYSQELQLRMPINFYDEDITIPGQELFGNMAGYLCKDGTTYCWLIVKADVEGDKARLVMSNDYGSEDLEAELTLQGDTLYVLRQLNGSSLKVPGKGKWQKLPKTIFFRPRK